MRATAALNDATVAGRPRTLTPGRCVCDIPASSVRSFCPTERGVATILRPSPEGTLMPSARSQEVPPDPAALIASMRAFGYSLPTAIADLVDNSITAGANAIHVRTHWAGEASWISVWDDGVGMSEERLVEAMRLGSRSPREERAPDDLGRFGLGLKTAAFSQATSLTVASRTHDGGPIAVRRWDLDYVTRNRSWSLLLDADEVAEPVIADLASRPHGTLVLLQGLDRLSGDTAVDDHQAADHFLRHADAVVRHLSMVFHRFISEDGLRVVVNDGPIVAWDPFLAGARGGQRLPDDTLRLGAGVIHVRPHVLPHFSNLSREEHASAAGPRGWNQQQGFYIYRARRLLVAGDWLGLPIQPEEHYKLARIRVDLDNSMDLEWQIDVRKASARIPREVTQEMRRIADATRRRAAEAYRYRGKNLARTVGRAHGFVWAARIHNDLVSYRIDRDHPVVRRARDAAGPARSDVDALLRLVEETVPIAAIVMDARERPDAARGPFDGRESEVRSMLRDTLTAMVEHGARPFDALRMLAGREPFTDHPQLVAALAEELEQ